MNDAEQAQRWVDEWADSLASRAERYQQVQEQVARIRLSATSPDGAVRVTVGSNGVPTDLELTGRTSSIPPAELSALILTTMRRAQSGIADRVERIMQDTVGQDTSTIGSIVGEYRRQFPNIEAAQEPPRRHSPHDPDGFGDESIMQ